jgi:hypothetical protein
VNLWSIGSWVDGGAGTKNCGSGSIFRVRRANDVAAWIRDIENIGIGAVIRGNTGLSIDIGLEH